MLIKLRDEIYKKRISCETKNSCPRTYTQSLVFTNEIYLIKSHKPRRMIGVDRRVQVFNIENVRNIVILLGLYFFL